MRPGESIQCPHCGEQTVVKSKKLMDGFTVSGEAFVCVLCDAELGRPGTEAPAAGAAANCAADKFAALLGDIAEEESIDLSPTEEYGRFCRNCANFIEHPFKTLCGLDGSAADPMGDCPRFERKDS